jgi:PTS system beta-glucosides-specific IIC component
MTTILTHRGIVAAFYPLIVATGMHIAMVPFMVQSFASFGYENFFYPAGCVGDINQGFASIAVAAKTKNRELKSIAISAGIPALLGKVTEPAIYGISLKYKTPMYCAMVGSFIGGCFAGLVGTKVYYFGGGGLLGFAGYIGKGGTAQLLLALAGLLIGGIVTFILTYIFYKDPADV